MLMTDTVFCCNILLMLEQLRQQWEPVPLLYPIDILHILVYPSYPILSQFNIGQGRPAAASRGAVTAPQPARGDGTAACPGQRRPAPARGYGRPDSTAAGPGRRRQHRPGATAAHTHRHSPYHAAAFAGARGTPSSTLPQARTVSVAAGP